ncbi:hypothetical protein TNCV_406861 [Trichonephila clavipes]|nr:hypothetical protein TNCV_406861 [Trichonephila clavipes]
MRERNRVIGLIGQTQKNPNVLENPRVHQRGTIERGQIYAEKDPLEGLTMNCRERGKRLYYPEPEILPGSSNQGQTRRSNPPHQQGSRKTRMEADRIGRTRSTHRGHRAAEERPFRSRKPTVRPCLHYLRSRFKKPEGLP